MTGVFFVINPVRGNFGGLFLGVGEGDDRGGNDRDKTGMVGVQK